MSDKPALDPDAGGVSQRPGVAGSSAGVFPSTNPAAFGANPDAVESSCASSSADPNTASCASSTADPSAASCASSTADPRGVLYHFFLARTRHVVLLCCFFILGTAVIVYAVEQFFVLLIIILILCLRLFETPKAFIGLIYLALVLGALNAWMRTPCPDASDISNLASRDDVLIVGRVLEHKSGNRSNDVLLIDGKCDTYRGRIQVFLSRNSTSKISESSLTNLLKPGSTLCFKTHLQKLQLCRRNIFLFRKQTFCRSHGIFQLELPYSGIRKPDEFEAGLESIRQQILSFHKAALGESNGVLMTSMILGDKAVEVPKDQSESFRVAGLSHILAASGFNLSIVIASIYFLARFFMRNLANILAFSGMCLFVILAGPSQSVLRAFLMGTLLLIIRARDRSPHMPTVLSLTAVMAFLVDPWSVADVGLQLSYLSTAGMIVSASAANKILDTLLPHRVKWLNAALSAALVAQLYVLPIQLYYFRQLSSYCLIANVVVVPVVPLITVVGFASSIGMVFEELSFSSHHCSACVDKIAFFPVELVRAFVGFVCQLPFAQIETLQIGAALLILYYVLLGIMPLANILGKAKLWLLSFSLVFLSVFVCAFGSVDAGSRHSSRYSRIEAKSNTKKTNRVRARGHRVSPVISF